MACLPFRRTKKDSRFFRSVFSSSLQRLYEERGFKSYRQFWNTWQGVYLCGEVKVSGARAKAKLPQTL